VVYFHVELNSYSNLFFLSQLYEKDRNIAMIDLPFEEIDSEESGNSLSDVISLDNDFARMQFDSSSSGEEVINDDVDLQV
jgi:hypothetical protein